MKLTIVSDLHVDIGINQAAQLIKFIGGDIIVVAGDTSNSAEETADVLNHLACKYKYVLYVDGNHEHYNNNYYSSSIKKDTIENNLIYLDSLTYSNVIRLHENKYFDFEEYRFLGNCGWYTFDYYSDNLTQSLDLWQIYSNDWYMIYKRGSTHQMLPHGLAKQQSESLLSQIQQTPKDKKIIVVTHTVPHKNLLHHKSEDQLWEEMSSFYYNSHNEKILLEEDIMMWINGHTHLGKIVEINGTTCISNPRGYPNENKNWKPMDIEL